MYNYDFTDIAEIASLTVKKKIEKYNLIEHVMV